MNQLVDHSQYYIFRAGQNEYIRLTVKELITFLIQVTEDRECRFVAGLFYIIRRAEGKNQGLKLIEKDVCNITTCIFCTSSYYCVGETLYLGRCMRGQLCSVHFTLRCRHDPRFY